MISSRLTVIICRNISDKIQHLPRDLQNVCGRCIFEFMMHIAILRYAANVTHKMIRDNQIACGFLISCKKYRSVKRMRTQRITIRTAAAVQSPKVKNSIGQRN